jgi:hypothetical protein
MAQFVVLVRETPGRFDDLSPEEMQQLVQRYHAWTTELAAQGRLVIAHKLHDGTGRVVRGGASGGKSVTDGPFAEGKEVVGGFWVIEADDFDHALETLSDHPHLGNGSLEVRAIENLDDL